MAPPAERPEVSPETARRSRRGLLPLAAVAMVSAAPAAGVNPTSNRGGRLLLAAPAALTAVAALPRHYSTVRLGAALTATLAAFRPPPAGLAAAPRPHRDRRLPHQWRRTAPTGPVPPGGAHAHGRSTIP